MKKNIYFSVVGILLGLLSVGSVNASTFSMKIVTDNDFAVFTGTDTGVNTLLYQNNYSWSNQISNLTSRNFSLANGDSTFYVLAMGGGGEENLSGLVNGVDMTSVSVSMSSNIGPFLSNYLNQNRNGQTIDQGTFNASLAEVQAAFSRLTWGSPLINNSDIVIRQIAPNRVGFHFDDGTAHLFKFSASSVGLSASAVPEPSALALLIISGVSLVLFRRQKMHFNA